MRLEDIQEAAKVIPVFMRNEDEQGPTLRLDFGCYACDHRRPLGSRTPYATVVAYGEDEETLEWRKPRFGFMLSIADSSFADLNRNHWARRLVNGATGFYDNWVATEDLEEDPTVFVRLLNTFGDDGVEHKHARVNFAEIMDNYRDRELFCITFEAYTNRTGLYVDPVDEIFDGRQWTTEELNRFVHSPYRSVGDQRRILEYYWNNITTPKRLTQLKAGDTLPDDLTGGTRAGNAVRERLNNQVIEQLARAERRAAENRAFERRNIRAAAQADPFEIRYDLDDDA